MPVFLETACHFAVLFKTARPKRQTDRWLAKTWHVEKATYYTCQTHTFVFFLKFFNIVMKTVHYISHEHTHTHTCTLPHNLFLSVT